MGYGLWVLGLWVLGSWVMGCDLWVLGYLGNGLWVMGTWVTGYELLFWFWVMGTWVLDRGLVGSRLRLTHMRAGVVRLFWSPKP